MATSPQNTLFRICLGGCLLFGLQPGHAQSALTSQLEIFQVQQEVVQGQVQERLTDVQTVEPGTELEYVLRYRNVSRQTLAGFDVRTPIPANTVFLEDTVQLNAAAQMQVSLDGGENWLQHPPMELTLDDSGISTESPIPAVRYTDLRWMIADSLAPEQEVQIRFRVAVQ